MYGLEGFAYNIANVYRIAAPALGYRRADVSTRELREAYRAFIRHHHKLHELGASDSLIVSDPDIAKVLLARIGRSKVDDLDQEPMIDATPSEAEFARRAAQVVLALVAFNARCPEFFQLFHLVVHGIALSCSGRNRAGRRPCAGSSRALIGLIWIETEQFLDIDDLVEIFVQEATHTLVYLDELNQGHFHHDKLEGQEYRARSAILPCSRPLDKAIHSIAVAAEVLHARRSFLGEPLNPRVHPASSELARNALSSVESVLSQRNLHEVCMPRAIELTRSAGRLIERLTR